MAQNKTNRKKLSQKEVILLGLIAEEPVHAYGLEEKIKDRHMTEWTEIGFSSIYRVLRQLEEKKLIKPELQHEGQGATRKVFNINNHGKKALAEGVLEFLSGHEAPKTPFRVGLAFICHAPFFKVLEIIGRQSDSMQEVTKLLKGLKVSCQGPAPKSKRLTKDHRRWLTVELLFEHILHHLAAEQKALKQTLETIKKVGKGPFLD